MNEDRTWLISVLFLDIFNFSTQTVEQQLKIKRHFETLVSNAIQPLSDEDLIQLDTGDGMAICYLGDPESIYPVACNLRNAFITATHENDCEYQVRMGLNLGPVKIVDDVNHKRNCIGSGITDAERVMSFAEQNQLLVSKSYFEIVSKMSQGYERELQYLGSKADKHNQQHEIYILSTDTAYQDSMSSNSTANASFEATEFDQDVIARITKEYCMYIKRSEAERIIQESMKQASSLKELCSILVQAIPSKEDQYSFDQYLKSYGYSGY